jgi:hypothetical protein
VNDKDAALYVRMLAVQLRMLPLADAVAMLRGALVVAGDHPAMQDLRGTFRDLVSADDQLGLLASGQLKLPLDGDGKESK